MQLVTCFLMHDRLKDTAAFGFREERLIDCRQRQVSKSESVTWHDITR